MKFTSYSVAFIQLLLFTVVMGPPKLSTAQTHTILNTNTLEPIPFATAFQKTTKTGATSNVQGELNLSAFQPTDSISIQALGFFSLTALKKDLPAKILLQPKAEQLREVVIQSTLTPTTISQTAQQIQVFRPSFFDSKTTTNLIESVELIPGLKPMITCGICNSTEIRINGLEGPNTLVLINGMPIISGLGCIYGLSGIPQSFIEQIEVVKGASSTLNGSDALAGTINIVTKSPENSNRFVVEASTDSWLESSINAYWKVNKKLVLGGQSQFFNSIKDFNSDQLTDQALFNQHSIFGLFQPTNHTQVFARGFYENRYGGALNFTPTWAGSDSIYGEAITTQRVELTAQHAFKKVKNLHLQFSGSWHQQDSYYGITPFQATQSTLFQQLYKQFTWNTHHETLFAAALRYTYYLDNTEVSKQVNPNAFLPGLVAQHTFNPNPSTQVIAGLRYDYHTQHQSIFTPRIAAKWSSKNKHHLLKLSAGTGFRVANIITEEHAALTGARTLIFEETLQPETSYSTTLNYTHTAHSSKWGALTNEVSLFANYFTNKILADYDSNPNEIRYTNQSSPFILYGLNGTTTFNSSFGLFASLGFTLLQFSQNELLPTLYFTEHFSGNFNLNYSFKKWPISIAYTGVIRSPMQLPTISWVDPRLASSPWFTLQGLQVSYTHSKRLKIKIGVENLWNITPPANSIARAHDPFDNNVEFLADGSVVATPLNPYALTFDAGSVFTPFKGRHYVLTLNYTLR